MGCLIYEISKTEPTRGCHLLTYFTFADFNVFSLHPHCLDTSLFTCFKYGNTKSNNEF